MFLPFELRTLVVREVNIRPVLNRCLDVGLEGYLRSVGFGVLAFNASGEMKLGESWRFEIMSSSMDFLPALPMKALIPSSDFVFFYDGLAAEN